MFGVCVCVRDSDPDPDPTNTRFRDCVRREIVAACGLETDECAFFHMEAMTVGARPPVVTYRLFDAALGPNHDPKGVEVSVPFDVLAQQQPASNLVLHQEWNRAGGK